MEAGLVSDEALAGDWLLAQLRIGLARADLAVLVQACDAWHDHDAETLHGINGWLRQTRESAEMRAQAEQMGRSLLDWLRNGAFADDPRIATLAAIRPAPLWPVAFALAGGTERRTPHDTALAFAWGWAENMAQSAMKAVPLGQAAAQRMLSRLAAAIPPAVQAAMALPEGRTPGAHADARHPERAARNPVLRASSDREHLRHGGGCAAGLQIGPAIYRIRAGQVRAFTNLLQGSLVTAAVATA